MTDQIDKDKAKIFNDEYLELCKKHKMIMTFIPQWKQSYDTGTYSLVIQVMIAPLPDEPV